MFVVKRTKSIAKLNECIFHWKNYCIKMLNHSGSHKTQYFEIFTLDAMSLESSFETTRKKLLIYYCRNVRVFLSYFRQCQVSSVNRLDQLLKFDIKNRQQKQWFTKNDSCRCFLGIKHEILHHYSHMPVRYDCRDCQYLAIPEMLQSHKTDTVCKCMFWDIGEPKIKTSSQSPL